MRKQEAVWSSSKSVDHTAELDCDVLMRSRRSPQSPASQSSRRLSSVLSSRRSLHVSHFYTFHVTYLPSIVHVVVTVGLLTCLHRNACGDAWYARLQVCVGVLP